MCGHETAPYHSDTVLFCGLMLIYSPVVGAPGFEPGTSCSQSKRANRAALRPDGETELYRKAPSKVQIGCVLCFQESMNVKKELVYVSALKDNIDCATCL